MFNVMIAILMGSWLNIAIAGEYDYLLGSGDVIRITVYSHPELALETRLGEANQINFPLLGDVVVGGMTTINAEKKLSDLLKSKGFIVNPQVNIIVTQYQSKLISVLGSVAKPGRYPLDRSTSLGDMLATVGGILPDGSQIVTVKTIRDGVESQKSVDIDILFNKVGDVDNIELKNGDTIYVPRAPMFYIYGEVQRPGSFRIERNMTIVQALAQGGGPTIRGTQRSIKAFRRDANNKVNKVKVELTDKVLQDDVIYVEESLF